MMVRMPVVMLQADSRPVLKIRPGRCIVLLCDVYVPFFAKNCIAVIGHCLCILNCISTGQGQPAVLYVCVIGTDLFFTWETVEYIGFEDRGSDSILPINRTVDIASLGASDAEHFIA